MVNNIRNYPPLVISFLGFVGGVLFEFVFEVGTLLATPGTSIGDIWDPKRSAAIVAGGIIGSVVTRLLVLVKEEDDALQKIARHTDQLATSLFSHEAVRMLSDTRMNRFGEATAWLVRLSMDRNFKSIPATYNEYLEVLGLAIRRAESFEAIQLKSLRWYINHADESEPWLREIKESKARRKIRVFVMCPSEEKAMREDLRQQELLNWYWKRSGRRLECYWINDDSIAQEQISHGSISDLVLLDSCLLIKYDSERQRILFDVIQEDHIAHELFRHLNSQLKLRRSEPFTRIGFAAKE